MPVDELSCKEADAHNAGDKSESRGRRPFPRHEHEVPDFVRWLARRIAASGIARAAARLAPARIAPSGAWPVTLTLNTKACVCTGRAGCERRHSRPARRVTSPERRRRALSDASTSIGYIRGGGSRQRLP